MNMFGNNKTIDTFCDISEFLLANSEQIKRTCHLNSNRFWSDIDEDQYLNMTPTIKKKEFEKLLKYDEFNKYVKLITQNRLNKIDVPYDACVLNYFIEMHRLHNIFKNECIEYCLCKNIISPSRSNSDDYETIATWLMVSDGELAYTYFYHLKQFQEFKPFIEHKQNYEQRHIRLLAIHERVFNSYDANNLFDSVFGNDYLIQTIMRFL